MKNHALLMLLVIPLLLSVPGSPLNAQQSASQSKTPPPLGKLIDVGGYRVHLYCTGQGSPTVMIVGAQPSFDWGLVQPEIAKTTQVCTYDPSGSAWSDPGPEPTCEGMTTEIHNLLANAGIKGPFVIVGHSMGAVWARLYTNRFPNDVVGMVIVDHAAALSLAPGTPIPQNLVIAPPTGATTPPQGVATGSNSGRQLVSVTATDFSKLPAKNFELHKWAASLPPTRTAQQQRAFFDTCREEANNLTASRPDPNGDIPLVVITSDSPLSKAPAFEKLQTTLLGLSHNSKRMIAENSGHIVQVDRPDVIISGINQVVEAVRHKSKLK